LTGKWIDLDGSRVEYARWGEGSALPVLLLHEGLGSVGLWKDFPDKLAKACNRKVIAWSRHGHGWSDPAVGVRNPDYMHREAALLPQLLAALDIPRSHWLGHSDGASIALIGAAEYPDRVASLILEAPHVLVEDLTFNSIAEIAAAFAPDVMGERMRRYHADPLTLFNDWSSIWLDPRFRTWNIEALLNRVEAPALLIQGHDDQYGTFDQLDRIAAHLPDVTRLHLDDCRHSPHFDQPEQVLQTISRFLEKKD